jgi:hypothetical protein
MAGASVQEHAIAKLLSFRSVLSVRNPKDTRLIPCSSP